MKTRTFLASLAVAVVATLPLAGVASAQPGDRDCPDFATQADAQAALDSSAGDPERLDANDDGVACESSFDDAAATAPAPVDEEEDSTATAEPSPVSAASTGQVSVVPQGAVDTGDGTSRDDGAVPLLLVLGGGAALGVAALRRHAAHQR